MAPTAAEAQQKVNAAVTEALRLAHQLPEVTAATGGYSVWRAAPSSPQDRGERWQAGQAVELSSRSAPSLLRLAGALQQRGFAMSELGWRLSEEASRQARQQALTQAVKALRGRADEAAGLLGLQFDQFKEVRLDAPRPPPMPRAMMAAAPMAAAATPPSAEPTDVTVSATAEADVLLKPR